MRTTGRLHRLIASILLGATALTACTSWHLQAVSPEQVVTTQHPSSVRVQRMDGSRVVMNSPRISTDSLVGTLADNSLLGTYGPRPIGLPLADVDQLAVRHGDATKTTVLLLAISAALLAGFYAVLASAW